MGVFGDYSNYYDLLYKDKDYQGEVDYVSNLIRIYHPGAQTILDLGCGTGRHDVLFERKGYNTTGVDFSADMINKAYEYTKDKSKSLSFFQGDIRNVRLKNKFDVVVSLFHVMSYQVTNQDLSSAIETAKFHLNENGIFIFDCWYGPGVLSDPPITRIKRMEDDLIQVTRLTESSVDSGKNLVDVNFEVQIREKQTGKTSILNEVHKMRYLFLPELEFLLSANGIKLIKHEEWLTGKDLTLGSWNATLICRV